MDKRGRCKLNYGLGGAIKTAEIMGNSLPNTRSSVPPDELFYGKPSDIYRHLIEIGRVLGYATNRSAMKGKFKEKSNPVVKTTPAMCLIS